MASVSDVGLFDVASNKRPLENGYVPNYKPRKISANRDFPPGCGLHAVQSDFKHEGGGGAGVSESGGANNGEVANAVIANGVESFLEADGVDIPKIVKLDGIKNSEIVNGKESSGVKDSNIQVDNCSHSINIRIGEVAEAVNVLAEIGPISNELPKEVESQAPEAKYQPAEFDRAESSGIAEMIRESDSSKEETNPDGQTTLKELNKVEASILSPKSVSEEAKSMLDAGALMDESPLVGSSQPLSSFHCSFMLGASAMLKDKYKLRRVSAVRDFPPGCGTNNLATIDASRKDYLDGVGKVEIKLEMRETDITEASTDDTQEGPPGVMLMGTVKAIGFQEMNRDFVASGLTSFEEGNGGPQSSNLEETKAPVGKETAVLPLKRRATVSPPPNNFGSGNKLRRVVVHGLAAAPYCPWRKGKLSSNDLLGESTAGKSKKNNLPGKDKSKAVPLHRNLDSDSKKMEVPVYCDADGNLGSSTFIDKEDHDVYDENLPYLMPVPIQAIPCSADEDIVGSVGKDIIVYSPDSCDSEKPLCHISSLGNEVESEVVHGLMAAPYCQWRKETLNTDAGISGEKVRNKKVSLRKKVKAVAKKSSSKQNITGGQVYRQKEDRVVGEVGNPEGFMLIKKEGPEHGDLPVNSYIVHKRQDIGVSLPPFGANYSSQGDARNRVRETLRLFHTICRKLLQKEEANLMPDEEGNLRGAKKLKRIDLVSAKIIKDKGKEVNTDKQMFGHVPGVEVGDEFQYRVELAIVGIHRLYQAGIDWMKVDGQPVAISIVASGAYSDDLENADVLLYSGQGGNVVGKTKRPEDQKLERGNLALRNSISAQTPVRVVRGWKETKTIDPADSRPKIVSIYVYDGLYTVTKYWTEIGPHGKQVFMFELRRNPGQPELAWKELKNSNKFKTRPGVCVSDISGGKEAFPICAVNTIDDEKPPPFNYTPKMIYPDWFGPIPPEGCSCTGRCSDAKKCPCAVRNGGEIPYNRNGAIVEAKPLVFECGPSCKCPPSCYNRVTQRGVKFKLEIFKTESRGWGIRPLTSIPSGSFICEYAGELLEDKEAEQRVGNDEYLFDIGQNYSDFSLNAEEQAIPVESVEEAETGYTVDAGQYGNVGRFVNHSCSPNLYAQNVMYDHNDKRMPHVMLFAAENIPPLQELTYHYNYTVDQVRDSNGNIKIKKCYCGSAECTGRMY